MWIWLIRICSGKRSGLEFGFQCECESYFDEGSSQACWKPFTLIAVCLNVTEILLLHFRDLVAWLWGPWCLSWWHRLQATSSWFSHQPPNPRNPTNGHLFSIPRGDKVPLFSEGHGGFTSCGCSEKLPPWFVLFVLYLALVLQYLCHTLIMH